MKDRNKTSFSTFKRKLRFSGSIGLERNNLNTARNATTNKMIGSAMVSYDPVRIFGITINYSNYSINQQPGRIQIADSVKLYQSNGTFMVMPHFQFFNSKNTISQFVSLVFSNMKLNDKNPTAGYNNSFTTINNMLTYGITFIPVELSVNATLNYNGIITTFFKPIKIVSKVILLLINFSFFPVGFFFIMFFKKFLNMQIRKGKKENWLKFKS